MSVDLSFFMTEPLPADPEPTKPKGKPRKVEIQAIKWDRKREKAHDQAMKLAFKAIDGNFRLPRPHRFHPLIARKRGDSRKPIDAPRKRSEMSFCDGWLQNRSTGLTYSRMSRTAGP
jgi:hypothetical protein